MKVLMTQEVKAGFLRRGDIVVTDVSDMFDDNGPRLWFEKVSRTEETGWEGNSIFEVFFEGPGALMTKQHHTFSVLRSGDVRDAIEGIM